jgi:hypothetical protein
VVASAAARAAAVVNHVQHLTPEQLKVERRQVVAYIARARLPIRQAAAARQLWIQDLSKVYEAIRSSPTGLILEKAGEVGYKHEPSFRDALSAAQGLTPPLSCEPVHDALIGWLTSLHSACLSLIDARRLKDRSLLGNFREHLSQARRQAALLASERSRIFTVYQLRVRPSIQRRRPRPTADAPVGDESEADERSASAPRPSRRPPNGPARGQGNRPRPRGEAASGGRNPRRRPA